MTATNRSHEFPPVWQAVLFPALAGAMGWGIRGQYGHETGAMIAGVLIGLTLLLLFGRGAKVEEGARAAALGAVALGIGGSMTYGQTIGLTQDRVLVGNWEAWRWGMLGLAIKGAIWSGFAGLFFGLGFGRSRVGWRDVLGLLAAVETGFEVLVPPLLVVLLLLALGCLDAFSGFIAAATFGIACLVGGGITTGDDVRGLLGLWVLAFAAPLASSAARPFRRRKTGHLDRWNRLVDFAQVTLFGAWAAGTMFGALPALVGVKPEFADRDGAVQPPRELNRNQDCALSCVHQAGFPQLIGKGRSERRVKQVGQGDRRQDWRRSG